MLKRLNRGLFEDCKSLKSINIPYNIAIIDSYVFLGCDNLDDIIIPLTTIVNPLAFPFMYKYYHEVITKEEKKEPIYN